MPIGTSFENFLKEEGIKEEVELKAILKVLSWKLQQVTKEDSSIITQEILQQILLENKEANRKLELIMKGSITNNHLSWNEVVLVALLTSFLWFLALGDKILS